MEINNLYDMIEYGIQRFGSSKAALMKKEQGEWQAINWLELKEIVNNIAKGLMALGMNKSNTACLLSNTRAEWTIIDLAIIAAGGITVPIYHSNTPSQCEFIINDSEAKMIFVEDQKQLKKILDIKPDIPNITRIITIKEAANDHDFVLGIDELIELGKNKEDLELEKRISSLQQSDIASFVYTSGTSGIPKGTVLTHQNFISSSYAVAKILPLRQDQDAICFLPLAHIFARSIQFVFLYVGLTQWYCESLDKISEYMMEARPQCFIGVPRFFEKVYQKIVTNARKGSKSKVAIFNWAIDVGQKASQRIQKKQSIPFLLKLQYKLADILVYSKIRSRLGGRFEFAVSGGAALNRNIAEFYHAVGLTILEGYGLTETTAASHVNQFDNFKFGTVGQCVEGVEAKLGSDGEILVRGNTVMLGYYKDEAGTKEALTHDRWFHTGDLGEIDSEGFLTIVDRKKDIIVLSNGKNIAPQYVENCLKTSDYISEAMVYGHKKKYLSALIVMNYEAVVNWAKENEVQYKGYEELARNKAVYRLISQEVKSVNKQVDGSQAVKKFSVLEREFTQESGELTPSLKMRRNKITENYQKILDQFYADRFN